MIQHVNLTRKQVQKLFEIMQQCDKAQTVRIEIDQSDENQEKYTAIPTFIVSKEDSDIPTLEICAYNDFDLTC